MQVKIVVEISTETSELSVMLHEVVLAATLLIEDSNSSGPDRECVSTGDIEVRRIAEVQSPRSTLSMAVELSDRSLVVGEVSADTTSTPRSGESTHQIRHNITDSPVIILSTAESLSVIVGRIVNDLMEQSESCE